jgi:hypothetical protein
MKRSDMVYKFAKRLEREFPKAEGNYKKKASELLQILENIGMEAPLARFDNPDAERGSVFANRWEKEGR